LSDRRAPAIQEVTTEIWEDEADMPMLPLGILPLTVRCPLETTTDALLIATWRADQFEKALHSHVARARKMMHRKPERFAVGEIGISDHDRRTCERLCGTDDVEACLVAAWLAVGVEKTTARSSTRSSWDSKLIERRLPKSAML
jgi:hypothetical protein